MQKDENEYASSETMEFLDCHLTIQQLKNGCSMLQKIGPNDHTFKFQSKSWGKLFCPACGPELVILGKLLEHYQFEKKKIISTIKI